MSDDVGDAPDSESAESYLLGDEPQVVAFFGEAYPVVARFHALLAEEGVRRGLIGPREVPRLWERHLVNCGTVAAFLPEEGTVVDVGSGAGLPGVVLAAMRPQLRVVLLEPMERRTTWLTEATTELGLANAEVLRGRAEEQRGRLLADVVTARAVAPMDRLARWCLPLLRHGGSLVAMKGRSAEQELVDARDEIARLGGDAGEVVPAEAVEGVPGTSVVRVRRVKPAEPQRARRRR